VSRLESASDLRSAKMSRTMVEFLSVAFGIVLFPVSSIQRRSFCDLRVAIGWESRVSCVLLR
jgi:hypothetical protein